MDTAHLATLVAAAELGSLSGAARKLGAKLSTVSRQVAQLEEQVGEALLVRTGRGVRPTPAGERFLERARGALRELAAALAEARGERAEPGRPLRVSAPVELALSLLPRCLAQVHRAHPNVALDVHSEARRVGLLDEDLDAALRLGRLADSELVARKLGAVPLLLCAAPRVRTARARDLAKLPRVGVAGVRPPVATLRGRVVALSALEAVRVSTFSEAAEVAARTELVALLPGYTAERFLAAGTLAPLLPSLQLPAVPVHLLVPRHHRGTPALRTLGDALRAQLAASEAALAGALRAARGSAGEAP